MNIPPIIRELASPASRYTHLKAVVGPREHDHNKPTLCGLEDHGSWRYAVLKTQAELTDLQAECVDSYPVCPNCVAVFPESASAQS